MRRRVAGLIVTLVLAVACVRVDPQAWLGTPQAVAPGVEFYQSADSALVSPDGPIAVYLLRLDLDKVQIESALSNDEVMDAERVDAIAQRHQAIAAVNAGFFNVKNGEPVSLLKVRRARQDTRPARGRGDRQPSGERKSRSIGGGQSRSTSARRGGRVGSGRRSRQ
jgi:hypothetical protein